MKMFSVIAYLLAVVAANWMIRHVGTVVLPNGTHLVPVWPGILAPSGVYAAGFVLIARDIAQRLNGRWVSLAIIVPGIAITALMDVRLAIASGSAFLFSELADYLVYTRIQKRSFTLAVFTSGVIGSVIDSVLFLWLAGIPFAAALLGQVIGKWTVQIVFLPAWVGLRNRLPIAHAA